MAKINTTIYLSDCRRDCGGKGYFSPILRMCTACPRPARRAGRQAGTLWDGIAAFQLNRNVVAVFLFASD